MAGVGIQQCELTFMLGAGNVRQCPEDSGCEVAFVGRSNAGKSSAVNTITGRKALARTSKQPGRTQQINFFRVGNEDGPEPRRLADLPGYGYAKVPTRMKQEWGRLIGDYLHGRQSLAGMVIVVDCRRGIGDYDQMLIDWCRETGLAYHILLTKADKLSKSAAASELLKVKRSHGDDPLMTAQTFSSLNRSGLDEARARVSEWLVLV
ncbi:MAG: YihA family ribosome biogenesis GTP-binding protein [Gammaproteobacteria bacterium]|nr:YihA family ribosome biogenesis GTP-binding protein [Gammaproteobacteria bacterium]